MRVAKVSVSGLFGLFHHVIPLRLNERITIIHGPNGYGKTIILKMLSGLFNDSISIFESVPFEEFRVELDDGKAISIRRAPPSPATTKDDARHRRGGRHHPAPEIVASFSGPGAPAKPVVLSQLRRKLRGVPNEILAQAIDRELPFMRVGSDTWREYESHEILSLDDIVDRFGSHLFRLVGGVAHRADDQPRDGENPWFAEVKAAISIRLIQTKRLDVIEPGTRDPRSSQPVATVKKFSEEVAERIKLVLAAYAARAQDLDRSFPQRLFSQQGALLSVETLRKRLAELEEKRARLVALGFLDAEQYLQPASEQAVAAKRDVLSVYAGDVEQKLAVFDEMANKIDLLTRIVNSRFLYKTMSISRERGFVFTSDAGSRLSPVDLSSGEQHELVLLYELLFKLKANSLVLIDEPEISLHPEWQEKFLGDLLEMVQLSGFDVLLATHSPEIIGSHMNLATELVGPPRTNAPPHAER